MLHLEELFSAVLARAFLGVPTFQCVIRLIFGEDKNWSVTKYWWFCMFKSLLWILKVENENLRVTHILMCYFCCAVFSLFWFLGSRSHPSGS